MLFKPVLGFDHGLYFLQFYQGLHRSQAIDVHCLQDFSNIFKGLGMGIENGQLHLGGIELLQGIF